MMTTEDETGCPEDWPDIIKEMRTLDNLMRCPICCELINTAMLVPKCSHTYCSLCIRRYSCFKSQCPTCATPVSEPELVNNRLVDQIVIKFKEMRPVLLEAVKQAVKLGLEMKSEVVSSKNSPETEKSNSQISRTSGVTEKSGNSDSRCVGQSLGKDDVRPFAIFSQRGAMAATKRKYVEDSDSEGDVVICDSDSKKSKLADAADASKTDDPSVAVESESSNIAGKAAETNMVSISSEEASKNFMSVTSPLPMRSPPTPMHGGMQWLKSPATPSTPLARCPSSPLLCPSTVATPTSHRLQADLLSPSQGQSPSTSSFSTANKVPCPVCQVEISVRNINIHLDRCLISSEKKENLRSSKRKLMPKLVYNLIKDGELRKKLTAVGLPTNGNRQSMINRHKEFTLIYNSECDSLNPRSAEEIVRDMSKAEKERQKQSTMTAYSNTTSDKLQVQKGASEQEVEIAQKNYVQKHKSQFAQLIADARKRMKKPATASASEAGSNDAGSSSAAFVAASAGTEAASENITSTADPVVQQTGSSNLPVATMVDTPQTTDTGDSSSGSDLFPDMKTDLQPNLQTDIQPDLYTELQPDLHTKLHTNHQPDVHTDLQPDIHTGLHTNLDTDDTEVRNSEEDSNCSVSLLQCSETIQQIHPLPADLNEPISVSSPVNLDVVLSQISDSNDIPLTQMSKSSKATEVSDMPTEFRSDTLVQTSSQGSTVRSENSDKQGDLSDYGHELEDFQDSDFDDVTKSTRKVTKKQSRPKKRAGLLAAKRTEKPVLTDKRQLVEDGFGYDDADFVQQPRKSQRARLCKKTTI